MKLFELGSSEVELAIDSANRRKKEFVILHVLDALSDSPQFRLLPAGGSNPSAPSD